MNVLDFSKRGFLWSFVFNVARLLFLLKRSMASGFAGVGNPLFVLENTRMLFGDANTTMQAVLKALKG